MSSARIPALDGIRAISIGLVLCAHVQGTGAIPLTTWAHLPADVGVRTFFVLSGFLITTLLLDERAVTGRISLPGFYRRRVYRIFPAFYTYLAVVACLAAAGLIVASRADLGAAATYTMNFRATRSWPVGHLWSLSVEEQFYLMWPFALAVAGARRTSTVEIIAFAALAVAPIARVAVWYAVPALRPLSDQAFPCILDSLATGCLLALYRPRLERWGRYTTALSSPWFWPVAGAAIASLAITRPWIGLGLSMTAANVALALVLHRCMRSRPAVLQHPALVRIGVLSFSLYLWQQLFLDRGSTAWVAQFPINLVLTFIAATLSYELIERQFLRLAHRPRAGAVARGLGGSVAIGATTTTLGTGVDTLPE